ncbi:MAG TPA: chalcone isomerase [Leucothrix sp.]|nr:chalcone isomerase [Leucothrix sp.]
MDTKMTFSLRLLPFLLSLGLLITSFSVSALNVIPNGMSVAGKQLVLNGVGTRTKFIISVYHAGLYLQKKNNNAQQIIAANEPMAIRMHIVSGFASASKMKQALNQGFHNSTGGKTAPIKAQIDQLLKAAFSGKVNKGDVFDLVYTPAGGSQVIKNKKVLTTVKGLPFKQALFGIWLSNRPAQASLKNQLLGKK